MRQGFRTFAAVAAIAIASVAMTTSAPTESAQAYPCSSTFTEIQNRFTAGLPVCLATDLAQSDLVASNLYNLQVPAGVSTSLDLNGHSLVYYAAPIYAGLRVPPTATITISDSVGTGVLDVTGGQWGSNSGSGAGIGGDGGVGANDGQSAGTILITGGVITATGGAIPSGALGAGAGIGGGGAATSVGSGPEPKAGAGGAVTISGGSVTAVGGSGSGLRTGAGIGSGSAYALVPPRPSGGTLTLNGSGTPTTAGVGYHAIGAGGIQAATVSIGTQPTGVSFTQTGVDADATTTASTSIVFAYSVSFDSAGGSSVNSQTVPYGSSATTPTAPTRNGYSLSGWLTGSASGPAYSFSTVVTAPVNLVASWTANSSPASPSATVATSTALAASGWSGMPALAAGGLLLVAGAAVAVARRRPARQ